MSGYSQQQLLATGMVANSVSSAKTWRLVSIILIIVTIVLFLILMIILLKFSVKKDCKTQFKDCAKPP